MKYPVFLLSAAVLFFHTACIQVNLPETKSKKTDYYSLNLPKEFKAPAVRVAVAEFATESPAKFKILSRTGAVLKQSAHAKWTQSPSVLLSSAFRDLYGCDDADYEEAKYLLEGDIYVFERNLDTKAADLKVLYRLILRESRKTVFAKSFESAIPIQGDTDAAFAEAMSKAVVEQAEKVKQEINACAGKLK